MSKSKNKFVLPDKETQEKMQRVAWNYAVVLFSGRRKPMSEALFERKIGIPRSTFYQWREDPYFMSAAGWAQHEVKHSSLHFCLSKFTNKYNKQCHDHCKQK